MVYLWLKALHVAAAMIFVGGVLAAAVLLRLLDLYQAPAPAPDWALVVRRLRRWQRLVTTPAMVAVWELGVTLAIDGGWFRSNWLRAKLVLVLALSAVHGVQSGALRRLAGGANRPAGGWWLDGTLVIALAASIVVLVIIKPF